MEFLLQKAGDRTYRSIATPTLTLPSGNYRLLGRTDSPHQDLEVRIAYDSPHLSERQTQYHRSDEQGFFEILPYRDFVTGMWEIRVLGDIMAELQGKSWQKALCLIVSPPILNPIAQLEQLIKTEIEPLLKSPANREVIKLKFADLEKKSAFIFDLDLPAREKDSLERSIELPNPPCQGKPLQPTPLSKALPPKLFSQSSCRGKSPQLPPLSMK